MKTLILAINAKYIHSALAPWYLKAAVRAYNECNGGSAGDGGEAAGPALYIPEPEILETNINSPYEGILSEAEAFRPDVLAVCCYIWNMALVEKLLGDISRRLPDCAVILGGPEVSYNAAERLETLPMVDYIVCGEGESPFVRLLAALGTALPFSRQDRLAAIPGLAWRRGGKPVWNPASDARAVPAEPGEPPDPFLPEYTERLAGRIAYLETSRGCPFSCGFCLSGRPEGVRFFDMERAKRDLLKLADAGTKTVKLVDRTFNCDPLRSGEIIRYLLEKRKDGSIPPSVGFHLEVAADLFDRETIGLLREAPAGLFQLEIGLQSFGEKTLDAVGRKTDIARLEENFRLLRERNNIHLHLDLIAGLPGEGLEAFRESFDRAFRLSPHMLQLGFLKLLHGSRLREQSGSYGIEYDPLPPYHVRRTGSIGEGGLAELALCEDALDRLYNSGRFPATVVYLMALYGRDEGAPSGDAQYAQKEETGEPSPCAFFTAVGRFIGGSAGMSLEDYIGGVIRFGESLPGADRETLRDNLVVDWLQTNHVGVLPLRLQRKDALNGELDKVLKRLYKAAPVSPGLGTRRAYGYGLLYGGGRPRVAIADYRQPRPFLGNYPLRVMDAEAALFT